MPCGKPPPRKVVSVGYFSPFEGRYHLVCIALHRHKRATRGNVLHTRVQELGHCLERATACSSRACARVRSDGGSIDLRVRVLTDFTGVLYCQRLLRGPHCVIVIVLPVPLLLLLPLVSLLLFLPPPLPLPGLDISLARSCGNLCVQRRTKTEWGGARTNEGVRQQGLRSGPVGGVSNQTLPSWMVIVGAGVVWVVVSESACCMSMHV